MNIRSLNEQILRRFGIAVCASAGLLLASAGHAQQPQSPTEQPPTPPQQQAANVSNEEVKAFANARARVIEIARKLNTRLQGMSDAEEMRVVQSDAQQKMAVAVVDSGLTVERYNRIAQAAEADSGLAKRIEDAL